MKKFIDSLIHLAQTNKEHYLIVVIGNVQGITKIDDDYAYTSIGSEFYTRRQFDDIVLSLRLYGFQVKCYFDELDFIHDYSLRLLSNLYPQEILVINFAQKGKKIGRKSLIPAFCDMNNILHTNCNPYVVSLCREKFHWYLILKDHAPVSPSWLYSHRYQWLFGKPTEGEKIIVKLTNESSSIGLTYENIMTYSDDADKKISALSEKYDADLIVQEFLAGYEIEVPFINSKDCRAFNPIGISLNGQKDLGNNILDYEIRGDHLFNFYDFSELFPQTSESIRQTVQTVALLLNIEGIGRVDFRVNALTEQYYITDINANPHITKSMTVYYAMKKMGYNEYISTLLLLIGATINRRPN